MKRIILIVCSATALSIFQSCNRQDVKPHSQITTENVKLEGGRLNFSDMSTFKDYIGKLNPGDKKGARTSFVSLYDVNNSSSESDTIYSNTEVIDPYFASVLNPEGEVKIDDKIVKVDSIYSYVYKEEDATLVDEFKKLTDVNIETGTSQTFFDGKLTVFKNDVHLIHNESADSTQSANGRIQSDVNHTFNFGNDQRGYCEIWTSTYVVYSSCGAAVRMQRKKCRYIFGKAFDCSWVDLNAQELRLIGYAYWEYGVRKGTQTGFYGNAMYKSFNRYDINKPSIVERFDYLAGWAISKFYIHECTTTNVVKFNGITQTKEFYKVSFQN